MLFCSAKKTANILSDMHTKDGVQISGDNPFFIPIITLRETLYKQSPSSKTLILIFDKY